MDLGQSETDPVSPKKVYLQIGNLQGEKPVRGDG